MTLREQVTRAICDQSEHGYMIATWHAEELADAVLVVVAERERLLRTRIEALTAPYSANDIDSGHRRSREHYERAVRDVLGVFDDES